MKLVVVKKDIKLFGKVESHCILCCEVVLPNLNVIAKPLFIKSCGKNGVYYDNYVLMDDMPHGAIIFK